LTTAPGHTGEPDLELAATIWLPIINGERARRDAHRDRALQLTGDAALIPAFGAWFPTLADLS
jgi:hypothetical protein